MPTPLAQVRQRRWRRLIPASLVAVAGIANTLVGLFPGLGAEVAEFVRVDSRSGLVLAGRVAAVEIGLVLLVLARRLVRGSRRAWRLAVLLTAIGAGVGVLHGRVSISVLASVLALGLLLITGDSFRLRVLAAGVARWWLPAVTAVGVVVFALVGYAEIDQLPSPSTRSTVAAIWRTLWFLPGGIDIDRTLVESYVFALRLGFLALILAVLWALRPRSMSVGEDRDHIRDFAFLHGSTSTAPLLALPDNRLLELDQGRAWAAVGVNGGAAISLGAPVAEPGREDVALEEFTTYCEQNGWIPALLATDRAQNERAMAAGYASIQIGVEAVLDVATFSTAGKRRSNIRHSVSRARREQVVVLAYEGTARTTARTAQLAEVSAHWLNTKGGPELGFTLGRFDPDRLDDQEVYVAIRAVDTPDEEVVAFLTWLPFAAGDHAVMDLMRRAPDCPPGVMELLIVDSLAHFAAVGRGTASLGGVPLARDPATASLPPEDRVQRLLGWLYDHSGEVYDARGLFRFKDKFAPRWEPMWLAYPSRANLPKIALAAVRAFLPPHVVGEILRARRAMAADAPDQSRRVRHVLAEVRARFDELDRGRLRHRWPGLSFAATLWSVVLIGTAAVTWDASWRLRPGVDQAMAWSAQHVLDGELWRGISATVLSRDLFMLGSLLVVTSLYLWVLERLSSTWTALAVWLVGAIWGFVGTTLFLYAGSLAGWDLATDTLTTSDYGPSGGTAAVAAVVVVMVRHRLVTTVSVAVLLIGSAAHHHVADVEHVIAFATVLLVAPLVRRSRRSTSARRDLVRTGSGQR